MSSTAATYPARMPTGSRSGPRSDFRRRKASRHVSVPGTCEPFPSACLPRCLLAQVLACPSACLSCQKPFTRAQGEGREGKRHRHRTKADAQRADIEPTIVVERIEYDIGAKNAPAAKPTRMP